MRYNRRSKEWEKAMQDLFETNEKSQAPLADRMRPRTLDEFWGSGRSWGKGGFCAEPSRPTA